jgi:hypothetical protein
VAADARTAVGLALAPGDAARADREMVVRICTGGGACDEHRARLRELDHGWFAARLPAGPVVVTVERETGAAR